MSVGYFNADNVEAISVPITFNGRKEEAELKMTMATGSSDAKRLRVRR